jgi:hypothetical protein
MTQHFISLHSSSFTLLCKYINMWFSDWSWVMLSYPITICTKHYIGFWSPSIRRITQFYFVDYRTHAFMSVCYALKNNKQIHKFYNLVTSLNDWFKVIYFIGCVNWLCSLLYIPIVCVVKLWVYWNWSLNLVDVFDIQMPDFVYNHTYCCNLMLLF